MTLRATLALSLPPALVLLGGCYQDIIDAGAALVSTTAGEWDTHASSSGSATPTTSAGSGEPSGTSDDTGEATFDGATTGPQDDIPPQIAMFEVVPDHLGEAGPAELQLTVSADVVRVSLTLDDGPATELTPSQFPLEWYAVSAADNGTREFKVVVEDAGGLTAEASDTLDVLLPASGVEKCIFTDPVAGAFGSLVSAVVYTPEAIVAVGARDTGAGLRMAAWKLDPNSCQPLLGWPRTMSNWSADAGLKKQTSVGVAVDVDADGNILVAGNLIVGNDNKPQAYVARLNPGGSRLWEATGQPGDEVTSVAHATGPYTDRVFVGGSRRTSDLPVHTDAAIWVYQVKGEQVFVPQPTVLAAPLAPDEPDDADNEWNESVHALMIQPGTDNALAVGERELMGGDQIVYSRFFTAFFHPLDGALDVPWTSWAPASGHDAIRSVTLCGDDVLAGGWTRDHVEPKATAQPVMFWLADDGTSLTHRHEPQLGSTEINGIACDRAGKIVSAATRTSPERDAQVFAVPGQGGSRTMYENGMPGDDSALAVACDERGFCGWGGYHTDDGKRFAVVRVHHP